MNRKFIINIINERDENNKLKKILKERKELSLDKQNLSDQIIILANEKQQLHCLVITSQQLIKTQKNKIKEKPSKNITFLLESKLIEYGIDRAKYHGGDLEGTSIVRMFQNTNEIFNQFKISITKLLRNERAGKTRAEINICSSVEIYQDYNGRAEINSNRNQEQHSVRAKK